MRCPFCQSDDTKVLDTRLLDDGSQVRRRRECIACGERHSTRETVDLNLPRLIKSDESRQTFSEDKLRLGLLKAFEKRPVSISEIETGLFSKAFSNPKRNLSSLKVCLDSSLFISLGRFKSTVSRVECLSPHAIHSRRRRT